MAAVLLLRANRLCPRTPLLVTELASALERMLSYGEAAHVVDASGLVARDPFCAYLSGFFWLMCGDRTKSRSALLSPLLAGSVDARIVDVRDRLAAMLARADALAGAGILDDDALTAWQMALNGTLLLHESPHGFPEPMHGRYAYVSDNPRLLRWGIERLHDVLDGVDGIDVPRIVHAPDRASRILGTAVARRFGRPLVAWTPALAKIHACPRT